MITIKKVVVFIVALSFVSASFGQILADSIPSFSYRTPSVWLDSASMLTEPHSNDYFALKDTLEKLNSLPHDSLKVKKQALIRAISTIRYMRYAREKNEYTVVVNIPSATLLLFKGDTIVLESKVIVGKPSNRTPTISSLINEVVLYPYWFVPKRIATRELLPTIKKNLHFLEQNGFQVLNEKGKLVNPTTINWHQLNENNFPYVLRQSTGCDNSLGVIKLNFYNPFNVYLHDTPWKNLFTRSRRFYSHGCIRVEKTIDLAHHLLGNNSIAVDTLEEKGCLLNKKPVTIPLARSVPIFVLYNTAWIDSTAVVRFYPDIYHKFPSPRKL